MKLIIKDLDARKLKANGTFGKPESVARMYSMKEYIDIAKRCIAHFASRDLKRQMLKSEDAISFVAEHLMYATCRWEQEKGRTLRSYHNQCAIWAIQNWMSRLSNARDLKSLNFEVTEEGKDGRVQFYEIIEDKRDLSFSDVKNEEMRNEIKSIIADSSLNDMEKRCVINRFIDHMKVKEIACEINKTDKFVYNIIDRAIKKLRRSCGSQI
jgi:RNA polymerase sigma factor (sigma-70 family)